MPADNDLYDAHPDAWWSPDGFLNFLQTGLNPARVGYFQRILLDRLRLRPQGLRALEVGCGGGLLTEEVARLGFTVTGVDPSLRSLAVARAHARASGLDISYVAGVGEDLPVGDGTYDVVFCCDVLEHVASVQRTVAEIARALRPGGIFCYDTVNRTWRSRVGVIKAMQEWRFFTCMEGRVHDWEQFIRPAELADRLSRVGIVNQDVVGFTPAGGPIGLLRSARAMHAGARGRLDYAEVGRRMRLVESADLSASYGGYAVKPAS